MTTLLFLWLRGLVHVTYPCVVTVWVERRTLDCDVSLRADAGIAWYVFARDGGML